MRAKPSSRAASIDAIESARARPRRRNASRTHSRFISHVASSIGVTPTQPATPSGSSATRNAPPLVR
jgi:hypothetical protein